MKRIQYGGTVHEFPDDFTDNDIQLALAQLEQSPLTQPAANEIPKRPQRPLAPTFAAAEPVDADFRKPSLKSALDIPLDIGIGLEQAAGIDPMHPLRDLPSKVVGGTVTALGDLMTKPLQTAGRLKDAIAEAVYSGGEALRRGDLPEAAQAVGRGVAAGEAVRGVVRGGRELGRELGVAARETAAPVLIPAAERLYESALKPGPRSNTPADVSRMVETGLRERIPTSPGGLKKLTGLQRDINAQVARTITDQAQPINSFAVARRLNEPAQRFAAQVNPTADLQAISDVGNEFLQTQPAQIPPTLAQRLKQGTYQQLKDRAYGELKTANVEGQKALARGLKEEIEARFPDVAAMNQRLGNLYTLQPELETALNRSANHNIFGIADPVVMAGTALATSSAPLGIATGFANRILSRPAIKSRLAIAMARMAGR